MDDKNLEILTLLRQGIPLVSMPWKELGDKLWIDEMSVISRIASMLQQGLIRYLGPFFDSRRLGYHGMLVGVEVPADRIPAVANVIQHESGVGPRPVPRHPLRDR